MASLLYRLGRFSYRKRGWVLSVWLVILLVVGACVGLFMGSFSQSFRLPGTETQKTLDRMQEIFPDMAGVTGTVVFETADGEPFTQAQQAAITRALTSLDGKYSVTSAIDPFAQQAQLDDAAVQVRDGRAEIEENAQKLEDGRAQLEDAKRQLAEGKKQVAENEPRLQAAAAELAAGEAQLADARSQLAQGQAQYDAGLAEYNQGREQLEASRQQLAQGQAQYDAGLAEYNQGREQLEASRQQLAQGQAQYDAGLAEYNQGVAAVEMLEAQIPQHPDLPGEIAALQAQLDALYQCRQAEEAQASPEQCLTGDELKAAIDATEAGLSGLQDLQQGINNLPAARASLEQARQQLDTSAAQLAAGREQVRQGEAQLATAKQQLDASSAQLSAGWEQLRQGEAELETARQQLDAAAAEIAAGKDQLSAGEAELARGRAQYEDGQLQLAQGKQDIARGEKEIPKAQEQLTDGQRQLDEGLVQLALGERLAKASEGLRFVSEDGAAAISQLTFRSGGTGLAENDREGILETLSPLEDDGINVMYSQDIVQSLDGLIGMGEVAGLVLAAVVLLIMMGTLIAAGLPILMALVGVLIGVGTTLALSGVLDINSITPILALMLGLAVGIDYTLFIVNRHRQQLIAGMEPEESVGVAIGTSGNAVVFAGLTVVITLVALVVPGLPFLSVLGLSAAFTVALAVLVAITLTPAMLGFIGRRIVSRRSYAKAAAHEQAIASGSIDVTAEDALSRNRGWGAFTTRHPVLTSISAVALLAVLSIPAFSMRTALPDGAQEPYGSTAQQAYETVSERFGGGFNGPMIALVDLPAGLDEIDATNTMLDIADEIRPMDGVVAAIPAGFNDDFTAGVLQIVPTGGPASIDTENLVHALRDQSPSIESATGAKISLAGQVVAQVDVSEKVTDALTPYLIIVVGLSLILLLLVFRSVVIPVVATGGFLLSLTTAIGTTVAVYQWGWLGSIFDVYAPGPILSFFPILLTGILFGLAMDYQVFLVSAMREAHANGEPPVRAIRKGFRASGPVVTAAALIMASVFAGFIFSHLTMVRPLGFGLAIGVLADAFIVRMTLTPAIMTLLGNNAWYLPKWLGRILPNVDVEGAQLLEAREEKADTKPTPVIAH